MIPIAKPALEPETIDRVASLLAEGQLADGPPVRAFEGAFADFCGADRGVATANGTTALHAALWALGVDDGDAVVTTPFSFVATANAIRLAGATPVFADVDPETYTLDPHAVESAIRDRDGDVAAILPVHLYGLPAEMDALADVAETYDAVLIEDACQAHGAEVDGRRVGSLGDAACFSFYPTKNVTTGEGGMITTDRADVAERAAQFVNHGRVDAGDRGYEHATVGHNFRMTSVAATIGLAQLDRLPRFTARRRENAQFLTDALAACPIERPIEPPGYRHVYHQYTIRYEDRDALAAALAERGVDTAVYYPTPIHRQPAYATFDATAPRAERAAAEVLSLPVHPNLSDADRRTIVDAVTTTLE